MGKEGREDVPKGLASALPRWKQQRRREPAEGLMLPWEEWEKRGSARSCQGTAYNRPRVLSQHHNLVLPNPLPQETALTQQHHPGLGTGQVLLGDLPQPPRGRSSRGLQPRLLGWKAETRGTDDQGCDAAVAESKSLREDALHAHDAHCALEAH